MHGTWSEFTAVCELANTGHDSVVGIYSEARSKFRDTRHLRCLDLQKLFHSAQARLADRFRVVLVTCVLRLVRNLSDDD